MRQGPERRAAQLAEAGIDAVNLHYTDWTGGLTALFHRFGRYTFGWDAQHERIIRDLVRMGIDGVFSDHVDRLVDAMAWPDAVTQTAGRVRTMVKTSRPQMARTLAVGDANEDDVAPPLPAALEGDDELGQPGGIDEGELAQVEHQGVGAGPVELAEGSPEARGGGQVELAGQVNRAAPSTRLCRRARNSNCPAPTRKPLTPERKLAALSTASDGYHPTPESPGGLTGRPPTWRTSSRAATRTILLTAER